MPRELVAAAPRFAEFRTYSDDVELKPNQVRIRTLYGSPKHGTELNMYRGTNPFQEKKYDPEWQLFQRAASIESPFPFGLGNMFVGEVIEVGSQVTAVQVSDRAAGYGSLRETHILSEEAHFNIPDLIFSRVASEPSREFPRWTRSRVKQVCWDLLSTGKINCEKIIDPVVDFAEADTAYAYYVDQHPEQSVKLGVVFPSPTAEVSHD